MQFLQEMNATVYKRVPGATTIAEESTSWPGVTQPTDADGLGFGFKWNMGWMHDTLDYLEREPVHRSWHHHDLTFGLTYAFTENFVLPLSHDEVVHGKGSLLRKMPGDRWQQLATLRAYLAFMWAHPGKQLIFMGAELGQESEWAESRELDWWLLDHPEHLGMHRLVKDLNAAYRSSPAIWSRENDPGSFQWIDANDAGRNAFSFVRRGVSSARPAGAPTWSACPTSPPCPTPTSGSGCRRPASGTRSSTPTPGPTPARVSATSGRSRPTRAASTDSPPTRRWCCRRSRRSGSAATDRHGPRRT